MCNVSKISRWDHGLVGMGKRRMEKRMGRAVAWSRTIQPPTPVAETRLAIW